MAELAGGFYKGDRVSVNGALGTVLGPPARAVAARLSVTVGYDDGTTADVRAANLTLLDDAAVPQGGMQQAPQQGYDDPYDVRQPVGGEGDYGVEAPMPNESRMTDLFGRGNAAPPGADSGDGYYPPAGDPEGYGGPRFQGSPASQEQADYPGYEYDDPRGPPPEQGMSMGGYGRPDDDGYMYGAQGAPLPYEGGPPPPMERMGMDGQEGADAQGEIDGMTMRLEGIDEALTECEVGMQGVPRDLSSMDDDSRQSIRTRLAQIEARAKSLEGMLDSVPTNSLPLESPLRGFKRNLLERFGELFAQVDYLFKELRPAASPSPPASAAQSIPRPATGADTSMRSTAHTFGLDAEPLAGGFMKGDRVTVNGELGTVVGRPARAAAARLSVSVHFDVGHVADARAASIQRVSVP